MVEVAVEGHLIAACDLWVKTNMAEVEEEEEAEFLFWLVMSEKERVVVLIEVAWFQVEEDFEMEGQAMRRKTKYRLSDWPG